MSGKASRNKGRRGETAIKNLLIDRDWNVADLSAGISSEDLIAVDPFGLAWAVECKNTKSITIEHRAQAIKQASDRKLPWMLISHICGTNCYLVQRKGANPVVWTAKQ